MKWWEVLLLVSAVGAVGYCLYWVVLVLAVLSGPKGGN